MRYETKADLLGILRDTLPEGAQDLYLEAYQETWDGYKEERGGEMDRDGFAHLQGMNAVELEYTKVDNVWYRKGEEPTEAEQEEQGILDQIKEMF